MAKSKTGTKVAPTPVKDSTATIDDPSTKFIHRTKIVLVEGFNARSDMSNARVKELAATIKREGQMSPIEVRKIDGKDQFKLISGFRRFAAICGAEKDGGLDRDMIKATVLREADSQDTEKDDMYRNLIENVQREDLTPFDLAARCAELKELEEKGGAKNGGAKVAAVIGKSANYVNNLIRVREKCAPEVLERWQEENPSDSGAAKPAMRVLTTDFLNTLATMPHAAQVVAMNEKLGVKSSEEEMKAAEEAQKLADAERAASGKPARTPVPPRAGKADLEAALEAAQSKRKESKNAQTTGMLDGAIAALKFALGSEKMIAGVYRPADPAAE